MMYMQQKLIAPGFKKEQKQDNLHQMLTNKTPLWLLPKNSPL